MINRGRCIECRRGAARPPQGHGSRLFCAPTAIRSSHSKEIGLPVTPSNFRSCGCTKTRIYGGAVNRTFPAPSMRRRQRREAKAQPKRREARILEACPFGRLNNSKISSSGRDSSHPLLAALRIRALLLQESVR